MAADAPAISRDAAYERKRRAYDARRAGPSALSAPEGSSWGSYAENHRLSGAQKLSMLAERNDGEVQHNNTPLDTVSSDEGILNPFSLHPAAAPQIRASSHLAMPKTYPPASSTTPLTSSALQQHGVRTQRGVSRIWEARGEEPNPQLCVLDQRQRAIKDAFHRVDVTSSGQVARGRSVVGQCWSMHPCPCKSYPCPQPWPCLPC